ncbi:MAG: 50S ribosomal protein L23 [Nanoarchaeota archaeon]
MENDQIIKYPLSNEKAIRMMESENKMVFVIGRHANKADVKSAIEKMFSVKVTSVNTLFTSKGQKRAYVRFADDTPAIDVATNLGMM